MATKETTTDLISTSTSTIVTSKRRAIVPKAGSVWESRMKLDQVKGGIKLLDQDSSTNNSEEEIDKNQNVLSSKQSPIGKRKQWKPEISTSELSPVQIVRKRSELVKNLDEKKPRSRSVNGKLNSAEKICDGNSERLSLDDEIGKSRSDEEFGVCEEKKAITCDDLENVGKSEEMEKEKEIEVEIEKKSVVDVQEISVEEERVNKSVDVKKKLVYSNERIVPFSSAVKKQIPVVNHSRIQQIPAKINPVTEDSDEIPRTHNRLQSLVDLIMWRDVSRSAFVFGLGTFFIISSSFTKDLNISFISVVSYLGLMYLAAIFTFRSLIKRGSTNMGKTDQESVFGEEEAVWLIKIVLPYINEFLLNLRALFSGDPATTMKLAVILYILARCGGSITIWKLAKLGFIGVFTVPKICASYSSQLTAYGKFWIQRFGDAWESCSHKKAVGFAVFTLVWNFSSVVARIWAVFMLIVSFKYYQQSLVREGWTEQKATSVDTFSQSRPAAQNNGRRRTISTEIQKQKKPC